MSLGMSWLMTICVPSGDQRGWWSAKPPQLGTPGCFWPGSSGQSSIVVDPSSVTWPVERSIVAMRVASLSLPPCPSCR